MVQGEVQSSVSMWEFYAAPKQRKQDRSSWWASNTGELPSDHRYVSGASVSLAKMMVNGVETGGLPPSLMTFVCVPFLPL